MSKEAARRFTEAYGKDDAIEREVEKLPKELCGSLEAIARVAQGLGYDAAPDELAEAFAAKRSADTAVLLPLKCHKTSYRVPVACRLVYRRLRTAGPAHVQLSLPARRPVR